MNLPMINACTISISTRKQGNTLKQDLTHNNREIAKRINLTLMKQKKASKWLAEQFGKDTSTISKWCTNVYQPFLENLDKIAKLLEVNRKDLLNDDQ